MDNGASSYRRFLEGDENGIAEIIREYKDGLVLYLLSLTQNFSLAEELMEETFVRLVVKKPRFSAAYSFKTWLYTIARNAAVDYFRHARSTADLYIADVQQALRDTEDLERAYLQKEQDIAVHRALQRLKSEYRQVLVLSFFEDFSNAQIAKVMHKSRRQVENLMYRGKQALKKELEREDFTYEKL